MRRIVEVVLRLVHDERVLALLHEEEWQRRIPLARAQVIEGAPLRLGRAADIQLDDDPVRKQDVLQLKPRLSRALGEQLSAWFSDSPMSSSHSRPFLTGTVSTPRVTPRHRTRQTGTRTPSEPHGVSSRT